LHTKAVANRQLYQQLHTKALANRQLYQPLHIKHLTIDSCTNHCTQNHLTIDSCTNHCKKHQTSPSEFLGTLTFHRHKTRSANCSIAKHKSRVLIINMEKTKTNNRSLRNAHALEFSCIKVCGSRRCWTR
jgi:hypothetical protein